MSAFSKNLPLEIVRFVVPLLILGGGVAAFAAAMARREQPAMAVPQVVLPRVDTIAVETHLGELDIHVDGVVVPHRELSLCAEVGGRIAAKAPECRPGKYVTAGTLLVEIDPRNFQLEVERLEQELEQAKVGESELQVDIANAEALLELAVDDSRLQLRQLERMQQLRSQRVASEAELDEALRAELASRNALATLQNQIRALQTRQARMKSAVQLVDARLRQARLDLERTKIVAPIDGMIVSEAVEMGSYAQPGTSLLCIEDTSAAEVRCNLRMEELMWLWMQSPQGSAGEFGAQFPADAPHSDYQLPHTAVTVSYRLGSHLCTWQGTLDRFDGIGLDERTRTVPCRVLVSEPRDVRVASPGGGRAAEAPESLSGMPRALVRGMHVRLTIHAKPQVALLWVPERSVQPGNFVWRVRGGKLNAVALRNTRPLDDGLLMAGADADLRAGDEVVVSPLAIAVEGMEVEARGRDELRMAEGT